MNSGGVCMNAAEFFLKKWSLLHILMKELNLINSVPDTWVAGLAFRRYVQTLQSLPSGTNVGLG